MKLDKVVLAIGLHIYPEGQPKTDCGVSPNVFKMEALAELPPRLMEPEYPARGAYWLLPHVTETLVIFPDVIIPDPKEIEQY